jgi:hypothetical protein
MTMRLSFDEQYRQEQNFRQTLTGQTVKLTALENDMMNCYFLDDQNSWRQQVPIFDAPVVSAKARKLAKANFSKYKGKRIQTEPQLVVAYIRAFGSGRRKLRDARVAQEKADTIRQPAPWAGLKDMVTPIP